MILWSNPLSQGASAEEVLNATQTTLDLIGLIPGVGELADAGSGIISLGRGDYTGAALSVTAMIPFLGDVAGATKIARRLNKVANAIDEARESKRAFSTLENITTSRSISNIATSTNATQAARTLVENGYTMVRGRGKTFNFYKGQVKTYSMNFRPNGRGATLEKYVPGRKKAVRKIRLDQQ